MGTLETVRALLFDIDGTLLDTLQLIIQALDHTYRKHLGITLPVEELRRLIGLPLAVQMRYLDEYASQPVNHALMEADERAYYESNKHLERVIPEAVQAVQQARQKGFKVALVTSKNRAEIAALLPRLALHEMVDTIVLADDVEHPKPAPDSVLKALERLQVKAEEALFIGDTVFDLTCGRMAGVKVAAVGWGAHLKQDLLAAQPDYYFETPADLLHWIAELPDLNQDGTSQKEGFRTMASIDHGKSNS